MALRTLIINNTAYQYPETGYDGRFGNLLPQLQEGSCERILQFDTSLTSLQLQQLGVTEVFDDHWVIEVKGNPNNPANPAPGMMDFVATEDLTITATGDVGIQSITRSTAYGGRRHQVVITCPNGGKGNVIIAGRSKIRKVGGDWGKFWSNDSTAPYIYMYGALPEQAMQVWFEGANTYWTHTGAMPSGLTYLRLYGDSITWTYSGALPSGLTFLYLYGNSITWTGNTLGNPSTPKPNFTSYLQLYDFRTPDNPMDYGDLNTLLRCLIDNVGTLPSTVIIQEQIPANVAAIAAANPVQDGTPAEQAKWKINWIKANKNVTTFKLNTTNI